MVLAAEIKAISLPCLEYTSDSDSNSEIVLSSEDLETLYRHVSPVIYRRSLALLANHEEALDAVQDVYLILEKKFHGFRGESDLMTWVYRVTTNYCFNILRRKKSHKRLLELTLPEHNGQAGCLIADGQAEIEYRDLMIHFLKHLDQRKA